MSDLKQPTDFPDVSIEDTISLTLGNAANPANVEFQLESSPSVTWWKGVEVHMSNGVIHRSETQDNNHGPHAFSLSANDLVGARLILAKAKIGVFTPECTIWRISPAIKEEVFSFSGSAMTIEMDRWQVSLETSAMG